MNTQQNDETNKEMNNEYKWYADEKSRMVKRGLAINSCAK